MPAPRFKKSLEKVSRIMDRARAHAESEMDSVIDTNMRLFSLRLKRATRLLFEEGMGSYRFRIVREGKRELWITSEDVYYSGNNAPFHCVEGVALKEFVHPLKEVLFFLDKCNSDYSLWPSSHEMQGRR